MSWKAGPTRSPPSPEHQATEAQGSRGPAGASSRTVPVSFPSIRPLTARTADAPTSSPPRLHSGLGPASPASRSSRPTLTSARQTPSLAQVGGNAGRVT